MRKSKILFQLSGSIACFKACALLSTLVKEGHEVEVVATASALKFVGEATLEGLTGRKVHSQTFEAGQYMNHIHLIRWADLILLAPATANTLNKMSAGIGDDLVTTLFLAHDFKKPYLIAPAMNQTMYAHPATQASIAKLSDWGVQVLGTGSGALACGENGEGRMLEPSDILAAIHESARRLFSTQGDSKSDALGGEKSTGTILITSGGTQEPIDGVRSITNTSSGRTGAELATWFSQNGYEVTLLHSAAAVLPAPSAKIKTETFSSFASLQQKLSVLLTQTGFDAVLHLAAVADYSLSEVESNGAIQAAPIKGKIDSGETLTLRLKKNPKLVDSIRSLSKNPNVKVIAFKLTRTHDFLERQEAVQALAAHARPDFVVHNDLEEISNGTHPFEVYITPEKSNPRTISKIDGAAKLAETLSGLIGDLP